MPFLASLEGMFGYGRFITAVDNVFSPSDIFGLGLWMDATTITGLANNASVTTWNDRGPYRLVGFGCNNPIYQTNILNGLPVVQFNAAQIVNFGNFLNLGTGGLFIAGVMRNAGTSGTFVAKFLNGNTGANGRYILYRGTTNQFLGITDSAGNRITPGYANANTQVQLYEAGWDRATVIQLSNGSTRATSAQAFAYNASNAAPLWLGAHADNTGSTGIATYWLNGYIAELVIYLNFPTTYERQQVEGYLAWKWGLQNNLPSWHPFRNTRPTNAAVAFQPTMLSNLQGWFDGSDPLATGTPPANGASVATWFDKSGWARNTSGGTAGFYSNTDGGLIRFNGSSTNYPIAAVATTFANQYFTVFVVERLGATGASRALFGGSTGTANANLHNLYSGTTSTTMRFGFFGNDLDATNVPAFTTPQPMRIWSFSQRRTSRSIYLNGSNLVNNANNTLLSGWGGASIGLYTNSSVYYLGNYHELLLYTGSLPYYDQQEVEGYLAWKWGLQNNLPSWHPFRSVTPSNAVVSFQPTMIENLQGWYDASDPLGTGTPPANGASVATWFDKSRSGRNAPAATAGNYSNLNGGLINFNGSTTNYTLPTTLASAIVGQYYTVYVVERLQVPSAGNWRTFVGGTTTSGANTGLTLFYLQGLSATGVRLGQYGNDLDATTGISAFTTAAAQPIRIWTFAQRVSFRAIYLFGSMLSSSTNNTLLSSWAGPAIGKFQTTHFYAGHMFEVIFFNGATTFFSQVQMEGYLAWKWGLQNSLFYGHPFRSAAPTTAATPFVPSMIRNLRLWLDANDSNTYTSSGSSILNWTDKSSYNYSFSNSDATRRPTLNTINNLTAFSFVGPSTQGNTTSQFLSNTNLTLRSYTNYSIFSVGKQNDNNPTFTGFSYIIKGNLTGDAFLGFGARDSTFAAFTGNGSAWNDTNALIPGCNTKVPSVLEMVVTGSSLTGYYNGTQLNTKTGTTGSFTGIILGETQPNNNSGQCWNGQVGEILIYDIALSFAQRQVVEGYLAWKWGIQANLPIGHPYRGQAPTSANIAQL